MKIVITWIVNVVITAVLKSDIGLFDYELSITSVLLLD